MAKSEDALDSKSRSTSSNLVMGTMEKLIEIWNSIPTEYMYLVEVIGGLLILNWWFKRTPKIKSLIDDE